MMPTRIVDAVTSTYYRFLSLLPPLSVPLLNPLTSRSFFSLFPYFFSQVHICIASTWWMSIDDIIRQTRRPYINIKQPSDLSEIENVYQKWIPSNTEFPVQSYGEIHRLWPVMRFAFEKSLMEGSFSRLVQTSSLWQLILSSRWN